MNGREGRSVQGFKRKMLLSRRTLVKGPEKPEFGHRPPV